MYIAGPHPPIEGGVPLQCLYGDVLLHQAVEEDGERGEADVVQRQIGSVIQRLQRDRETKHTEHHTSGNNT